MGCTASSPTAKTVISLSVYIQPKWNLLGQPILTVENNSFDVSFTFQCDKDSVTLAPGQQWEHDFFLGATAMRTMSSIQIMSAQRGRRVLQTDECEVNFVKHEVALPTQISAFLTTHHTILIKLALTCGNPHGLLALVVDLLQSSSEGDGASANGPPRLGDGSNNSNSSSSRVGLIQQPSSKRLLIKA